MAADRSFSGRAAVLLCLLAAAPAIAQTAQLAPWRAAVEHRIELPAAADGKAPRELSGLAWDARRQELVAVSDRGRLFRYRLRSSGDQLQAEAVMAGRVDRSAERGTGAVDAEGLVWRPDGAGGELLVAGETAPDVLRLADDGRLLGRLPWPAAIAASMDGGRGGVEAIAWHPQHGLLAAPQTTARDAAAGPGAARFHWIHAASGATWHFPASGRKSHLKAIEVLADGSLLLLERVQAGRSSPYQPVLRWLNPAQCGKAVVCTAPALAVDPEGSLGQDNQEGLACDSAGICWLVNDSGPDRSQASRLTQFRLLPR